MTLFDRVSTAVRKRSWPIGDAVVQMGDSAWGHAQDTYAPPEYGDYLTTSNGVYRCVTLRARLLSSLPLLPYRLRPRKHAKEPVSGGPLLALLESVNPFWTLSRLLQTTEMSLGLWGHCPWFVNRGTSGKGLPTELFWGRPDLLRPIVDPEKYITGYLFYPANTTAPLYFEAGEVVWMRYPNPLDEFTGLSPLAAARIAADYGTAAMRANKALFEHGLHMGGMISLADKSQVMTDKQAKEIETLIDRRYSGSDNAHRWMVLKGALTVQGMSITPKDADFLGGMTKSLEDIAGAYGIPLDLIGGQRTYENVSAAMRALWTQTMRPEAQFIASELTEQLLPMFGGTAQADLLEFDFSEVEELKEEESESWARAQSQIATGAITINEWRADTGLEPVPWGDVAWMAAGVKPVKDGEPPPPPTIVMPGEEAPSDDEQPAENADEAPAEDEPRAVTAPQRRGIAYGSEQHRALWQRFVARADKHETAVGETVAALFRRQQESILAKLGSGRAVRDAADLEKSPFDKARWQKEFRVALRPHLVRIVAESGEQAITDLGLGLAFDVTNPAVRRFIEQRAQRFAREVNETTWDELRKSLAAGIEAGEDMDALANRVKDVMGGRVESSKETIARTETLSALAGGSIAGWQAAQDVIGPINKHWLAALDDRTRDTHIAAHERYNGEEDGIPLEDDFQVGAGSGPGPGLIDLAEETINCRCTMVATPAPF